MLHTGRALQALENNRDRFKGYDRSFLDGIARYEDVLSDLAKLDTSQIVARLPKGQSNGAVPSAEWDACRSVVIPFGREFENHQESREWAAQELHGKPTFAVDGSQIQPVPDVSVPVAAVQIGWFENPHDPTVPYTKDVRVEVLPPGEVFVVRNGLSVFSDQSVSLKRFGLEVEVLCDWMRQRAGLPAPPVGFFDGSLVVSFAERLEPEVREFYISESVKLLRTSEETRVPLVGFVDGSRARDLTTMLSKLFESVEDSRHLTDADVLAGRMSWGDRTPAWICDRVGALSDYVAADTGESFSERVCFLYLRTSGQNPPARIEIPRWIVEDGLTEYVVQVVRAETVVGNGYPYVIETADAVAVITAEDRNRFYNIFEQFAARNQIKLRVATKIQSKYRRR